MVGTLEVFHKEILIGEERLVQESVDINNALFQTLIMHELTVSRVRAGPKSEGYPPMPMNSTGSLDNALMFFIITEPCTSNDLLPAMMQTRVAKPLLASCASISQVVNEFDKCLCFIELNRCDSL